MAETWAVVGEWLNHFGGSWAQSGWLTEGKGATPTLQSAAEQLTNFVLQDDAIEDKHTDNVAFLMAQAVVAYQIRPDHSFFTNPRFHNWLKNTLFSEPFWQEVNSEVIPPA